MELRLGAGVCCVRIRCKIMIERNVLLENDHHMFNGCFRRKIRLVCCKSGRGRKHAEGARREQRHRLMNATMHIDSLLLYGCVFDDHFLRTIVSERTGTDPRGLPLLDNSTRVASSRMVVLFDFCYWRVNATSKPSFTWFSEAAMHSHKPA